MRKGGVIPGYERTKCIFEDCDGRELPLVWEGRNGGEFAGTTGEDSIVPAGYQDL